LKDNLSSYSDEELIAEITEYNPEILEVVWQWARCPPFPPMPPLGCHNTFIQTKRDETHGTWLQRVD
jgi:hypothetical protein